MQNTQNTESNLLERDYQSISESTDWVSIGGVAAQLPTNPFWKKFAQGWEPDTERIYRELIEPGATIVDIGAWIGSTLMFGLACGAKRIVALEPNPASFQAIRQIQWRDSEHGDAIELLNLGLSDEEGMVTMGVVEGETDTSTSGLAGNDFEVKTVCWETLVESKNLDDIDLVKIDIEGAEALLSAALVSLSKRPNQAVHLSVHVPVFPEYADVDAFVKSLENFSIQDDRGEGLSHKQFSDRVLSKQSHPHWGTQHGNYFELLLRSK